MRPSDTNRTATAVPDLFPERPRLPMTRSSRIRFVAEAIQTAEVALPSHAKGVPLRGLLSRRRALTLAGVGKQSRGPGHAPGTEDGPRGNAEPGFGLRRAPTSATERRLLASGAQVGGNLPCGRRLPLNCSTTAVHGCHKGATRQECVVWGNGERGEVGNPNVRVNPPIADTIWPNGATNQASSSRRGCTRSKLPELPRRSSKSERIVCVGQVCAPRKRSEPFHRTPTSPLRSARSCRIKRLRDRRPEIDTWSKVSEATRL